MREEVANDHTIDLTILDYFQNKSDIKKTRIYKNLFQMPKGAIHHMSYTASVPIDHIIKLTYDDRVYFNQRLHEFRIYPKHANIPDGFIQTVKLREFYSSPTEFDLFLRKETRLQSEEVSTGQSHVIW